MQHANRPYCSQESWLIGARRIGAYCQLRVVLCRVVWYNEPINQNDRGGWHLFDRMLLFLAVCDTFGTQVPVT